VFGLSWVCGGVQLVAAQPQVQVPASKTLPEEHAARQELSVAQKFGDVFGHPQRQLPGSWTWEELQAFGSQTHPQVASGIRLVPQLVGRHSQPHVSALNCLGEGQLATQLWLLAQNSWPPGQPSQAQLLGLKTNGSGQSYTVYGQVHPQLVVSTTCNPLQVMPWSQTHSQLIGSGTWFVPQMLAGHPPQAQVSGSGTLGDVQVGTQPPLQQVVPAGQALSLPLAFSLQVDAQVPLMHFSPGQQFPLAHARPCVQGAPPAGALVWTCFLLSPFLSSCLACRLLLRFLSGPFLCRFFSASP
jgi:hypothetical protein